MLVLLLVASLVDDPPLFTDQLTVTATRTAARVAETPASVVVLSREELEAAAPTIDDALRQIPGFTLFRRSGSRTANPTSQGVSLRGIGGSGASRVVVLDDGVPLNDPFGGWVYWGRVPRASVDRIEVVRGGASELYGSGALSGVIQILRRNSGDALNIEASYGSDQTADTSIYATTPLSAWRLSVAADLFRTDGYIAVRDPDRGTVDRSVNSRRSVIDLTLARDFQQSSRLFLRGSYFSEARGNGTPLQTNDTDTMQLSSGLDTTWGQATLSLRAYALDQMFHQSFSAIGADRESERLTRLQKVPIDAAGLAGQFVRDFGRHTVVGGTEIRWVEGFSEEQVIGATTSRVRAGGTQRLSGLYIEDILRIASRFSITATARLDDWRNIDRSDTAFSPRLAAIYELSDGLSIAASAYRSFRAPTLNELYRSFRVGNVLTLANEELGAERLRGLETSLVLVRPRFSSRATLFLMEVERNIANVTLMVEPDLITRQRQNLGETRSRGVELDAQMRVAGRGNFSAGYLFVDAEVRDTGLDVAQVPRHQATLQLQFGHAAIQARWSSRQFEDDQNQLPLRGYLLVDGLATYPITDSLEALLGIENIFEEDYEVGRTPVIILGAPRSLRLGIRWRKQ